MPEASSCFLVPSHNCSVTGIVPAWGLVTHRWVTAELFSPMAHGATDPNLLGSSFPCPWYCLSYYLLVHVSAWYSSSSKSRSSTLYPHLLETMSLIPDGCLPTAPGLIAWPLNLYESPAPDLGLGLDQRCVPSVLPTFGPGIQFCTFLRTHFISIFLYVIIILTLPWSVLPFRT